MKTKKFLAIIILAAVALAGVLLALTACDTGSEHVCEHKCATCQKCTNSLCQEDACKEKCPVGGRHEEGPHQCESKCPVCGKCTNVDCQEDVCKVKCEKHGDAHVCASKCAVCGKCTDSACKEPACAVKCQKHGADHMCLHVCDTCGKCTDENCKEDNCADKCRKHSDEHVCSHVCPICQKCTDETCKEEKCTDKCRKHGAEHVCLHECAVCHKCADLTCEEDNCSGKCAFNHDLLEYDMSGVTFADKTVTFNGQSHGLAIAGDLPDGLRVNYVYYKGDIDELNKLDSEPVNAGVYTVVAKFTGAAGYKPVADKQATLTVNKATFVPDGNILPNKTAVYNGNPQIVTLNGNLPEGVSVTLEYYNGEYKLGTPPVNAGEYRVVAKFTSDGNYNPIADKTAVLTIEKATFVLDGITLENVTVTYDKQAHGIEISGELPAGLSVSYEYYNENNVKLDGAPTEVGVYRVVAKFSFNNDNYKAIDDLSAFLTIKAKEKVNISVTLGATKNADGDKLVNSLTNAETPMYFTRNDDGSFSAFVAADATYTIELFNSNVPNNNVNIRFYAELNDDGTVKGGVTDGELRSIGDVRYALITLVNEEDKENFIDNLVVEVKAEQRVVEISTYDDLLTLASDIGTYSSGVRLNAVYKLINDIDCGGKVWKTIGSRFAPTTDIKKTDDSFIGTLDGQNYKIYNFKLTDESVDISNLNDSNGILLGFFGFLSDATVKNVTFADITVDFSVVRLSDTEKYGEQNAYNWTGKNWIYFGVVAGRTNLCDIYKKGTQFENIKVENLNAKLSVTESYVGTFVGFDTGSSPELYNTNQMHTRSGLVATDVNIVVEENVNLILAERSKPNWESRANARIGGFTGGLFTYMPLVYEDCSITNLKITAQRDLTDFTADESEAYMRAYISGFTPFHFQVDGHRNKPEFAGIYDGFKNCSIKNYTINNFSNFSDDYNNLYGSASLSFAGCTASNDEPSQGEEYGFFRYLWNTESQRFQKWVYTGTPKWTHECTNVCSVCGKCTDVTCTDVLCSDKCQKHGDEHICLSECPVCHKCYNETCTEANCVNKCLGHTDDEKLTHDMTKVTFDEVTVTFDGQEHSPVIGGALPEGVEVSYEYYLGEIKLDSVPVSAGAYRVVANFAVDDRFYNPVEPMETTLTIEKANYDLSGYFKDKEVTYNGQAQTIGVTGTLPDGVSVESYEYYLGETKLDSAPVNAGTYGVVVKFAGIGSDYEAAAVNVVLKILKADIEITLGATANANGAALDGTVKFHKADNDLWNAYCAVSGTFVSYSVELLNSSVPVNVTYHTSAAASDTGDNKLSAEKSVYLKITAQENAVNYNELIVTVNCSVPVKDSTVVEMRTYEDLLRMANDAETLPSEIRQNLTYKLMNDIDCGGNVWKTIGAISEGAASTLKNKNSFVSEFNGQDYKIFNFQITEESVDGSKIPNNTANQRKYALAFGFFGYVSEANVHNVAFDSVTVDIDVKALGTGGDKYAWTGNSFIDFGVVAGYVGLGNTTFRDIAVTNLNVVIDLVAGRVGAFFGVDMGREPDVFKSGAVTERKNLTGSNIGINVTQAWNKIQNPNLKDDDGSAGAVVLGGFVGKLYTYAPTYYVNCSLTDVTLALGINEDEYGDADRFNHYYTGVLGGFVGKHNVTEWTGWSDGTAMDAANLSDKFTGCSITNYKLINWTNHSEKGFATDVYCGLEVNAAGGANKCGAVQFEECGVTVSVNPEKEAEYGIFHDVSVPGTPGNWGAYKIQRYRCVVIDGNVSWTASSYWQVTGAAGGTTPEGVGAVFFVSGKWIPGAIPA